MRAAGAARAGRLDGACYSQLMALEVRRRRRGTTRLTRKGQMTMPKAAQEAAGFRPGDVLRIEATGPGRVVVTLEDDPITRYAGSEPNIVPAEMTVLEYVRRLREEWPD